MFAENKNSSFIFQDVSIVLMSVLIAVMLVKSGVIIDLLNSVKGAEIFGSFIAGMFFTSVFTTAPSIAALGEITRVNPVLLTAFWGALGAVVGDLIIFRFIKDRLSDHLTELVQHASAWRRFKELMKLRYFRWFTFMVGGMIIVSPLPDELAISLFGFTKMTTSTFIKVSFIFNFIGIYIIGIVARSL